MVLIRHLSEEYSLTSTILENAKIRSTLRSDRQFKEYMNKIYVKLSNPVLRSLKKVNGLPLDAFLLRISCITHYKTKDGESTSVIIEQILYMLTDYPDENQCATYEETNYKKILSLRTLCELATSRSRSSEMLNWIKNHSLSLNRALIYCMDNHHLAPEVCFTIAYLARKFHFDMLPGMDIVIAGLVRALAIAMIPTENNVASYRAAADQHLDRELYRARTLIFHHPPYEYEFDGTHHYLIAVIYFTLADLVSSIPSPRLINFFHCRLFRRKEMTRMILFQIFKAIALNLASLEASALELSKLPGKDADGKQLPPLNTYEAVAWPLLPAQLYADLLRIYNEHNLVNKRLLVELMQILKAHNKMKLPLFEDEAIRTMQVYINTDNEKMSSTIIDRKKTIPRRSMAFYKPTISKQKEIKISYDEDEGETIDNTELDALELSSYMSEDMGSPELSRLSIVPAHLPKILDLASMLRRQNY